MAIQNIIMAAAAAASSGGHRYWRLNITQSMDASNLAIAELQYRGVRGGANLMLPGGSCSTIAGGTYDYYPASYAIDGSIATNWLINSGPPVWWQYDFGGSPQNIVEISIAESNAANGSSYQYGPRAFNLVFSDDATAFTTFKSWTTGNWTNSNTPRVFN